MNLESIQPHVAAYDQAVAKAEVLKERLDRIMSTRAGLLKQTKQIERALAERATAERRGKVAALLKGTTPETVQPTKELRDQLGALREELTVVDEAQQIAETEHRRAEEAKRPSLEAVLGAVEDATMADIEQAMRDAINNIVVPYARLEALLQINRKRLGQSHLMRMDRLHIGVRSDGNHGWEIRTGGLPAPKVGHDANEARRWFEQCLADVRSAKPAAKATNETTSTNAAQLS